MPKGQGMKKFDGGDVVDHLKQQATEIQKREKVAEQAAKIQKSSWLQVLEREREEKIAREAADRQLRAQRLAHLFEEEDVLSGDDEDLLDFGAADFNQANFMDKIEAHLNMEKKLLEAWQEKDEAAAAAAAAKSSPKNSIF